MSEVIKLGDWFAIGKGQPLTVLAGPCVIESQTLCLQIASEMAKACNELGLNYVFKASFDKANRTSVNSFRGPGLKQGMEILAKVKQEIGVPIVTDIHEAHQAEEVGKVADIIQIPAFLCRQTDLLLAAGKTGRVVNIKKAQFLAADDMNHAVEKVRSTGNRSIMLCERGTSFGYHNLVVDMRGLYTMGKTGLPVVFDCTHAVQLPGGQGGSSGGNPEFILPLAKAAAAVGIQALFIETHPEPTKALSDGANSMPLAKIKDFLKTIKAFHELCN